MIDIIIDKIIEGLKKDLMSGSDLYSDHLVDNITNKGLTEKSPNMSIAIIEDEAVPLSFDISSQIAQTSEQYRILIQFLVRSASEEEGKEERRIVTRRIKHSFLRRNGNIFEPLLTAKDEDTGYNEKPRKYEIERTRFDNDVINGQYLYVSETSILVQTEVNYYNN